MRSGEHTEYRAFTLSELVIVKLAILIIGTLVLTAAQGARDEAMVTISMTNLKLFGTAHATYASEWEGRQWTTSPDNLAPLVSEVGGGFPSIYPGEGDSPLVKVPSVPLGFDRNGTHHERRDGYFIQPMWDADECALGSFRAYNTKPFAMYLNGKVYDMIFWAPKDKTRSRRIDRYFEDPGEWPTGDNVEFHLSTYCTAMSAMLDPGVFRAKSQGGFQDPLSVKFTFRSPNLSQALYPDLKTHMLEHEWLQNPPEKPAPAEGVEWPFNASAESAPATLFYDGHVRLMAVKEAVDSNRRVIVQSHDPLWIEEGRCFKGGYFDQYAVDPENNTSYHVFTRDGIKGRDTTGN